MDAADDEWADSHYDIINEYLNNINDFIKNSINEGMNTFADVPAQEVDDLIAEAPLEEQKSDAELSMSESGRSERFSSNFDEI